MPKISLNRISGTLFWHFSFQDQKILIKIKTSPWQWKAIMWSVGILLLKMLLNWSLFGLKSSYYIMSVQSAAVYSLLVHGRPCWCRLYFLFSLVRTLWCETCCLSTTFFAHIDTERFKIINHWINHHHVKLRCTVYYMHLTAQVKWVAVTWI